MPVTPPQSGWGIKKIINLKNTRHVIKRVFLVYLYIN